MRLVEDWDVFKGKMDQYVQSVIDLHKVYSTPEKREDIDGLVSEYKTMRTEIAEYLEEALDEPNNEYARDIRYSQSQQYQIQNVQLPNSQKVSNMLRNVQELYTLAASMSDILFVMDAIVRPDEVDLEERKKYTIEERLEFLLEKLYALGDSHFYSINSIFKGNGIVLQNPYEDRNYANRLEELGYIETYPGQEMSAKISFDGKILIQSRPPKGATDYSKIEKLDSELSSKMDEIIHDLKMKGLGQEILFEEMQILKDQISNLDRKSWGQLLKSKLVDLGLDSVINKDVAQEIYEELTSNKFLPPY